MTIDDVKRVQSRLVEFGLYRGKIDGDQGPLTNAALMAYAQQTMFGKTSEPAKPSGMTVSLAGRLAISNREGVRLKAYQDSVNIWTIGVGHTSAAGPPRVMPDLTITSAECDEILTRDLAKFEAAVLDAVKVPLAQHEFDALVSLAFNIGGGAFAKSTLVKRLNAGDRQGAADAFLMWDKAGGKTLKGLTTRRKAERLQFLGL